MDAPVLDKFSTAAIARTYKLNQSVLVLLHVQTEPKRDVYDGYPHSLLQFQSTKRDGTVISLNQNGWLVRDGTVIADLTLLNWLRCDKSQKYPSNVWYAR